MSNFVKAVYPGTFDPVTNGHIDIISRARKLFSHLTVAVYKNPQKLVLFPVEKRLELLSESIMDFGQSVAIDSFGNQLLIEYCKEHSISVIVRGLRAVTDFEYEFQMYHINQLLAQGIETIFFMTSHQHSYLSSSIVKEVAKFGGDLTQMVPDHVSVELKNIFL
ncbi:MAG: pantetheine-phosphate adenylyltransferase [bacterium]